MLSKRRAEALRREMEKPAEEPRDAATVVNEAMDDWLCQTPAQPRSELAKKRRPEAETRGGSQIDPVISGSCLIGSLPRQSCGRVRFHDLRNGFASLLLQNGESLTYVKPDGPQLNQRDGRYLRTSHPRWKSAGS